MADTEGEVVIGDETVGDEEMGNAEQTAPSSGLEDIEPSVLARTTFLESVIYLSMKMRAMSRPIPRLTAALMRA